MEKEKLLLARMSDKIRKYQQTGEIIYTAFLDPLEQVEVTGLLRNIPFHFWGGYENAERKIAVIGSEDENNNGEIFAVISITSHEVLNHRNVLGSIMGLGITREKVGDILVNGQFCDIIVQKDLTKFILNNLKNIGKEKVTLEEKVIEDLVVIDKEVKEIIITSASMRLDAIISSGLGVSREKSSSLISAERVSLNYKVITNQKKLLQAGDLISIRGYGRLEIAEVLGETRKDRIRIKLKKY